MTNESVNISNIKSMLSQLKDDPSTESKPYIDYQKTRKSLEDIDYFVNHALKYKDDESISRAAKACYDLGIYLESKVKID
jgi:hypothetical protein